ncbi:hypothetical protein HY025_04600 [Candidatus Daviesbacteria bacterium]|nr:hypothetical protein [Candidatus Daviesbacteria bacterium]
MKKIFSFLIVSAVLLLNPLYPVYAMDSIISSDNSTTTQPVVKPNPVIGAPQPIFGTQDSTTSTQHLNPLEVNRANLQQRAQDFRERIATKEAALKAKLAQFKDKNKAEIVDRINRSFAEINKKVTDEMTKHLDKLTELLGKVQTKLDQSSATDKSSAQTAIDDAKTKIADAKGVVSAQALKDYTVSISSESAAKASVMTTRKSLHDDLLIAFQSVKSAREAVISAIRATMKVITPERNANGQQ